MRNIESVWLRLDASRRVILALEIPWDAARSRCSNKKGYSSWLYTGAEYSHAIMIRAGGAFATTVARLPLRADVVDPPSLRSLLGEHAEA